MLDERSSSSVAPVGSSVSVGGSSGSRSTMIPRIIWMLWFDGWDKAPELHRRCVETWHLYNRDWEVRLISRRDLPGLLGDYMPRYERLRHAMNPLEKYGRVWIPPAAESDLLRLKLLETYGGCWVDSTMLCRRPLSEWLPEASASGFFAYSPESQTREEQLPVMSSFMASSPAHPLTIAWLGVVERHWSKPSIDREDLGFFWLHKLFGPLVAGGPGGNDVARVAWAKVPKVTGEYGVEGPHYWVKYNDTLRPRPTEEHRVKIDSDRETAMFKLTNHEVHLHEVDADTCFWVLLNETRRQAREYAAEHRPNVEEENIPLMAGAHVYLQQLVARPDLNGRTGILAALDEDSGRWQVRLEDGSGTKLLLPKNLQSCSLDITSVVNFGGGSSSPGRPSGGYSPASAVSEYIGSDACAASRLSALAGGSKCDALAQLLAAGNDVGCH